MDGPALREDKSSRRRTRESGSFVRDTPGSRSLSRGLLLLRAFRGGITALSNAELAEFSGLPRSTVSRLTRTLVDAGFLEYHIASGTYRLGPPLWTLGSSVRSGSRILKLALPAMRGVADKLSTNVGLAVEDWGDMVYLDSIRRNRLGLFRRALPGTRIPVAETALGRAWLAAQDERDREACLRRLSRRYGDDWPSLERQIRASTEQVERVGWCEAKYRKGELVSMAMPLRLSGLRVHALNLSYPADSAHRQDVYADELLALGRSLVEAFTRETA
ncbi:MAG: helix-turn-helix domain-containing protein [Burkholderiaceae bacterium]